MQMKTISISVANRNHNCSSNYTSRIASLLAASMLIIGLSSCTTDNHDDLVQYVNSVKAKKGGRIPPLPEFKTQEAYTYDITELRDPFSQFGQRAQLEKTLISTSSLQPNLNRNRETLETFPLDALIFSGRLELGGEAWAIITAPDGFLHKIKVGNYLGLNYGEITDITETTIQITELVTDGLGGWIEREAAISVKE